MSRVPSGQRTLTVYFDGSCPLCRAEIDHYSRQEGADALCFCDVSEAVPQDLTQQQAMARFHVRDDEGVLVSGAAAFVSIWRVLPKWRWAARVASLPGMMNLLEICYRTFLPIRPALSAMFGAVSASSRIFDLNGEAKTARTKQSSANIVHRN